MEFTFPGEQEAKEKIEGELAGYFDLGERLLQFWLEADKDTPLEQSVLHGQVKRVAMAMSIRSCKQLKSVLTLCGNGEGADAAIISRSMFETALVTEFVLTPQLSVRDIPPQQKPKQSKGKKTELPTGELPRELRANLYLAHHALEGERIRNRVARIPELADYAKASQQLSPAVVQAWKDTVGEQWTDILLSHPFTYSGLSIKSLAERVDDPMLRWYHVIYADQSANVHSQDIERHVQFTTERTMVPRWHDSPREIQSTLNSAITLFIVVHGIICDYFDFNEVTATAIRDFGTELHSL